MDRLLVLACSQRKRDTPGLLPARDRYDGPAFRVLRRYETARADLGLAVFVLSAEFGLIPAETPIPSYDRRLTADRGRALAPAVDAALAAIADGGGGASKPESCFVVLGRDDRGVLERCGANAPRRSSVSRAAAAVDVSRR